MKLLAVVLCAGIGVLRSTAGQELDAEFPAAVVSHSVADSLAEIAPPCPDCVCPTCRCATCECPVKPAPCQPCPHVSTLQPFWNVNIFGTLQANMMYNTARAVAPGIPMFLAPGAVQPENTVDIFARSSSLGALFTGPDVGNFKAGGLMLAMFYNDALIVDRYGFLPLQAFGELRNEDWRIAAGLQFNVFSPNLPTMLTFSSLIASGNAGNNFPGQFRVERYLHPDSNSQWTIQAALSDPIATGVVSQTPISQIITGAPPLRISEDNGWPNIEGRIAYATGELKQEGLEPKRAFEIGVSAVGGQLRTAIPLNPNVVANTYGLGVDLRWRINERWGIVGEGFVGQGLGFLNAGVLQSTNTMTFNSIRTRGAWGEIYHYLTPCLHTHVGAGFDDPLDADLNVAQITYNQTVFGNLIWDVTHQFRVGFEVTYRETDYVGLPNNQGVGLQTQVQWTF
ncbi:hypothetical protein [Anatilimnocola aggregata]|nr:hypothetical protein [Anatilimnocola aggregata]